MSEIPKEHDVWASERTHWVYPRGECVARCAPDTRREPREGETARVLWEGYGWGVPPREHAARYVDLVDLSRFGETWAEQWEILGDAGEFLCYTHFHAGEWISTTGLTAFVRGGTNGLPPAPLARGMLKLDMTLAEQR